MRQEDREWEIGIVRDMKIFLLEGPNFWNGKIKTLDNWMILILGYLGCFDIRIFRYWEFRLLRQLGNWNNGKLGLGFNLYFLNKLNETRLGFNILVF